MVLLESSYKLLSDNGELEIGDSAPQETVTVVAEA
jgi:hypothetical protein